VVDPVVSKQVLDLDETLIHSVHMQRLNTAEQCDLKLEIYIDGKLCRFFVYFRPHAQLFLETVAEWFVNYRVVRCCVSTLRYTLQQQYQL
jgi:TFIIF-interacting CTD phosphatase-like protein